MEGRDERKEIAEDLGAATTGRYVAALRRQRSARKRAKKPSGLPKATLSAAQRHEAQQQEAKRRRQAQRKPPQTS